MNEYPEHPKYPKYPDHPEYPDYRMTSLKDAYNQNLIREQGFVQKDKCVVRLLDEYNQFIFNGKSFGEPRTTPTEEFLNIYCRTAVTSFEDVFARLSALKRRPITWIEMGGGRGLAMRQLALSAQMRQQINMINVDLFDPDTRTFDRDEIQFLEKKFPGIISDKTEPQFIQANCEVVELPKSADVITSVEAIQYFNNPLAAICNWYNQLVDNGILIIATEHKWSGWIRYEDNYVTSDPTPLEPFFEELQRHNIPFAISDEPYRKRGWRPDMDVKQFRNLILQKKPNTSMVMRSPVTRVWTNPHHYKAAYYQKGGPIIEITSSNNTGINYDQYYKEMNAALSQSR